MIGRPDAIQKETLRDAWAEECLKADAPQKHVRSLGHSPKFQHSPSVAHRKHSRPFLLGRLSPWAARYVRN
eukprot:7880481-Alexandrium_andersonii.AAC.1